MEFVYISIGGRNVFCQGHKYNEAIAADIPTIYKFINQLLLPV